MPKVPRRNRKDGPLHFRPKIVRGDAEMVCRSVAEPATRLRKRQTIFAWRRWDGLQAKTSSVPGADTGLFAMCSIAPRSRID